MRRTKTLKGLIMLTLSVILVISAGVTQGCRRGLKDSETVLVGVITDVQLQVPVSRVQIEIRNTSTEKSFKGTTDQQGRYKILCESGYYEIQAKHPGYIEYTRNLVLGKGNNQEDFYMSPRIETPAIFEGLVIAEDTNKPLENVTIQVGTNLNRTDARGRFKFDALPLGTYPVWVTVPGYEAINETITMSRGTNTANFTLRRLKLSDITIPAQAVDRNPVYAIDPTFLGDYQAHTIRVLQPMNERHEYQLISETRHRKQLMYDEHVDKGEVLYLDDSIYIRFLGEWQVPEEIHTSFRPDAFLSEDITMVSYYFNYPDKDFEIKELGSEKMNGYSTKKYRLSAKSSAPVEKQIDVELWMISDESNPRIHRMLTRIKGRVPVLLNIDTWAEIDTNITHINQGNKIDIPTIHKSR
jgi:hypothetical protein